MNGDPLMRGLLLVCTALALPSAALAQAGPSPFTTVYRYDAAHRLTGAISPDPDGSGPLLYPGAQHL
jgi:hypothetical protein